MTSTKMIVGNWKMHGLNANLAEAEKIAAAAHSLPHLKIGLCPPATLLSRLADAIKGSPVFVGGQNCHWEASGPVTGAVSAEMLVDAGATWTILGHSERRLGYAESCEEVRSKTLAALRAGLKPIICVGESLEDREAGRARSVVEVQLRDSIPDSLSESEFAVSYEPIWAIGTGATPTAEQIEAMHKSLRLLLEDRFGDAGGKAPLLYGGSVRPRNAAELLSLPYVDGALIGGASLKGDEFIAILNAAPRPA